MREIGSGVVRCCFKKRDTPDISPGYVWLDVVEAMLLCCWLSSVVSRSRISPQELEAER